MPSAESRPSGTHALGDPAVLDELGAPDAITVGVFPCGSEIGMEIHRSLAAARRLRLIGLTSVDDHGRFRYDHVVSGLPFASDPAMVADVAQVVGDLGIDVMIGAHDDALAPLATAAATEQLGCVVMGSASATARLARSKLATYAALAGVVRTPTVFRQRPQTFPVFAKPDRGQGSKGARMIVDQGELDCLTRGPAPYAVTEFLPGAEHTIDCFTDRHGVLRIALPRTRERIAGGISVRSRAVTAPHLVEMAHLIAAHVDFRGPWFFQTKDDAEGVPALLEIAPRVAGTMGLTRCRGINLPLMGVYDALGMDLTIPEPGPALLVDRALTASVDFGYHYDHVYLDFDDTLVVHGRLNLDVVRLIFECRNRAVPVTLLTRSQDDVVARLHEWGLGGAFAETHHVAPGQSKADFIGTERAIFVDDSFAEREDVRRRRGIPVIDVTEVEGLLHDR